MLNGMDGQVAIVTGAGQGLGRAEAVELARQGVRVVINDFAPGGGENPAEAVAAEIRAEGGQATAHAGDVADWNSAKELVGKAIETYGSLDILINNAGVLRDRMIFNMSEEDWDLVIRVHLKGHFCTLRHASEYWRNKSKETSAPVNARVVNTSSEAGLLGSAGQSNYASAKGGILQLTLAVAQGLRAYGVNANAIAPRARTQMTESLGGFDAMDDDFAIFAVENVSPLVAFLASPQAAAVSGQLFIVYGRKITVVAGPAIDEEFTVDDQWTPDNVASALAPFYEKRTPLSIGFVMKYESVL